MVCGEGHPQLLCVCVCVCVCTRVRMHDDCTGEGLRRGLSFDVVDDCKILNAFEPKVNLLYSFILISAWGWGWSGN